MDIKNTKELIVALNVLVIKLAPIVKNGLQVTDLIEGFNAINSDPVAKAELEAALADVKEIPNELKDITIAEAIELAIVQVQQLPALIAAFKA